MADPRQNQPTSTSTINTPAIGVPGQIQTDAQGNSTYVGYTATHPGAQFGTYQDPFNPQGGTYGLSYPSTQVIPRYFDGDQWQPANLGIDDMIALQNGLKAAGLYSGDYTLGVWGLNDVSAYERLLSMANAAGADDKSTLTRAIAGAKTTVKQRAPLVVKLTNPDDLKKTLQNVSQNLYGGNLPDADQQHFVDSYNAMESAAQQQAYSLGDPSLTGTLDAGAGGSVYKPSDPSVAAEKQIRAEHPLEVAQQGFVNEMDNVLKTFGTRLPGGGVG